MSARPAAPAAIAESRSAVLASRHARTFRRGRDLADLPLPDRPLTDPDNPQVSHSMRRVDGRVEVETQRRRQGPGCGGRLRPGLRATATRRLIGRDQPGASPHLAALVSSGRRGVGMGPVEGSRGASATARRLPGRAFTSDRRVRTSAWSATPPTPARSATRPAPSPTIGRSAASGATVRAACMWPPSRPGSRNLAIANPAQATAAEINQSCGECHGQHSLPMPAARTAPDWTRFPGSTLPWSRCYAESGGALSCVTATTRTRTPRRRRRTTRRNAYPATPRRRPPGRRRIGTPAAKPEPATRSSCPVNPSGVPELPHAQGPLRLAPRLLHRPLHPGPSPYRLGGLEECPPACLPSVVGPRE